MSENLDQKRLQSLLEEKALARNSLDISKVRQIKEKMERAEARKLQPHFIATFFKEALAQLGGMLRERESGTLRDSPRPPPLSAIGGNYSEREIRLLTATSASVLRRS